MNTADGFGILNSLRTQENHEGLLIDTLEQRREKLACAILGDYPTFKSSVKKAHHGLEQSAANGMDWTTCSLAGSTHPFIHWRPSFPSLW
jgi:hypothetical protein